MGVRALIWCLLLLFVAGTSCQDDIEIENTSNANETYTYYKMRVESGIIDPELYPYVAFARDQQAFRTAFADFEGLSYAQWLTLNNFGVLADTREPLLMPKPTRSTADNKRRFLATVRKGDILITGHSIGGLIGHAAIMTTDCWVLEMPGGSGWEHGIEDNNRQIGKDKWFDIHKADWTTVYRLKDSNVANSAATWADHHYYDPKGGATKTIHIKYKITGDVWSLNPSYCSKLVIHAYYYGTGSKPVINKHMMSVARTIVPTLVPKYFTAQYPLINKGKF